MSLDVPGGPGIPRHPTQNRLIFYGHLCTNLLSSHCPDALTKGLTRQVFEMLKYISNSQLYATYTLNCQSQGTHPTGVCTVGQVQRSATHAIRHHQNSLVPNLCYQGIYLLNPTLRIFSNSRERAGNRAVVDRISKEAKKGQTRGVALCRNLFTHISLITIKTNNQSTRQTELRIRILNSISMLIA